MQCSGAGHIAMSGQIVDASLKRSWKKLHLVLPLDLPPPRSDLDVTVRDAAEERVASRWM
jgi:hypothetical protein